MKKKLSKGLPVFLSEKGHRGFDYPSAESESLLFDVDANLQSLAGGGNFKPFKVPENSILALGDAEKEVLVWVNVEHNA
jgi:hypothetical protein